MNRLLILDGCIEASLEMKPWKSFARTFNAPDTTLHFLFLDDGFLLVSDPSMAVTVMVWVGCVVKKSKLDCAVLGALLPMYSYECAHIIRDPLASLRSISSSYK